MKDGKPFFDVWMKEESDNIQNLAQAYGERMAFERCLETIKASKTNKALLEKMVRLFGVDMIKRDAGFYLMNEAINPVAAKNLSVINDGLVKDVAACADDIVESLGIPDVCKTSAIAGDYVKYNEGPNRGELVLAKL